MPKFLAKFQSEFGRWVGSGALG